MKSTHITIMDMVVLGVACVFDRRADREFRKSWEQVIAANTEVLGVDAEILSRRLSHDEQRAVLEFVDKLRRRDPDLLSDLYFFSALGTQILQRAAMMN